MKKQDKFSATWLSHSSIGDYLKCPRLYYLKNVWKNENKRKVNIVSPHMSLGSAVHQVIEPLGLIPVEKRLELITPPNLPLERGGTEHPLLSDFEEVWKKYTGRMGGFEDAETEEVFKKRGIEMIKNVIANPGPLKNKTVKFYQGDFIPNIYLSEKENIILCGLVDWVEYNEKNDTLRVIDFKTGKNDEKEDSFQLPIYKILVESLQKRKVENGAYWYLDRDKNMVTKELLDEDIEEIKNQILKIGLEIKSKNKKEENFKCKYNPDCWECKAFELIYDFKNNSDKVEYLGVGEYKQDLYLIKN